MVENKHGIELLEELYALPDQDEMQRRVAAMSPEDRQGLELAHRHKRDQLEAEATEAQEALDAGAAGMRVCESYGFGMPGNEELTLGDIFPLMGDEEKRVVLDGLAAFMKTGYQPFEGR